MQWKVQSVCKCFFKFIIIKILLSCQVEVNKLLINYFFCKYETILSMFSLSISVYSHIKKDFWKSNWHLPGTCYSPHSSKRQIYILSKPEDEKLYLQKIALPKKTAFNIWKWNIASKNS